MTPLATMKNFHEKLETYLDGFQKRTGKKTSEKRRILNDTFVALRHQLLGQLNKWITRKMSILHSLNYYLMQQVKGIVVL